MKSHLTTPEPGNQTTIHSPPQNLWIYSFRGRFPPALTRHLPNYFGAWVEEDLSFLFFSAPAKDVALELAREHPQVHWLDSYQMPYMDWIGGDLQPFSVGRVYVRPVWAEACFEPPSGGVSLCLDPGVVFGGGTHQTTLDCLKALNFLASQDQNQGRILDVGSGTGILSLAAAGLGWQEVVAVDLNPLAAWTTWDNVRRNGMQDRVLAVQGRAEGVLQIQADTVVANIHHDVLAKILHTEAFRTTPRFILSGLLRSQAMSVLGELTELGAAIDGVLDDGTWFTLVGQQGR